MTQKNYVQTVFRFNPTSSDSVSERMNIIRDAGFSIHGYEVTGTYVKASGIFSEAIRTEMFRRLPALVEMEVDDVFYAGLV